MSSADFLAMLPFAVLAAAAIVIMLLIAAGRDHRRCAWASAIGLILAFAAIPVAAAYAPRQVTALFVADAYALFYLGLILVAALAISLLSYGYLESHNDSPREEYYVLLLLATLGATAMVASSHFAGFFLGLETLSISLFGLIAYPRRLDRPVEASIKYLILSGISSAFLLFGIALIYADLGTLSFARAARPALEGGTPDLFWLTGIAMFLAAIGFKLSLVPFHMWAPDVYEGAPAPVAAFVAVVSKSAVLALLLRYFLAAGAFESGAVTGALSIIAILSMIAGNLLALLQDNVKRILAYSSIAHLGYALVAFLAGGPLAIEAVSIYLVAYVVTTLGAFGVVTLLSPAGLGRDADQLVDYRGLFWTRPQLAAVFAAMLLSLAGIPLTVGFIAKFYAFAAGVGADLTGPVAALVAGSIIGLYYYLRIIVATLTPLTIGGPLPQLGPPAHQLSSAVMAALMFLLISLGAYPSPLIALIRTSADVLAGAHKNGP